MKAVLGGHSLALTLSEPTLDVVATSGSLDVATTQVTLEDQSTDTVVYESLAN